MAFRVGLTADLLDETGTPSFGREPLALLDHPGIEWEWLPPLDTIGPEQIAAYDALYVNTPSVTAAAFRGNERRTRIIARHGVGYDSVDVDACTNAGVLLTIQPDGVRRPVAVAALSLVLALSQNLMVKHRITQAGRWNERLQHMGTGLIGRSLGVVGAGSIGKELLALSRPFGLRLLAADPYADPAALQELATELVGLDELLSRSDYVVILVPLSPLTHRMIGAAQLARMKPSAMLINIARGAVVDEAALIMALQNGAIAGAALDVFEQEPVERTNPLLEMDQVIVTPHSLCWTDQCFAGIAESGLRSILDVAAGRVPGNAVNPQAGGQRSGTPTAAVGHPWEVNESAR